MLQNRIVCIVGPKGTGKTHHAAQMYGQSARALIFNVAFDAAYDGNSLYIINDDIIAAGRVMRDQQQYRISFTSEDLQRTRSGGLVYASLDPLIRECYDHGPMTIFLDEAHMLVHAQSASDECLRMVYIGRHHQLSQVFIMQRANGVHPLVRANADEYHFFRISEPLDLKLIRERCGLHVAERVRTLKRLEVDEQGNVIPGEYLVWTVEGDILIRKQGGKTVGKES
jgi:hypothetical protein